MKKTRNKEAQEQTNKKTNKQTNKQTNTNRFPNMQKNTNCLNSTTHFYPKQSTTPGSNTNPTCDAPNPHEARHVHDVFLSKLHLRTPIIVTTVSLHNHGP